MSPTDLLAEPPVRMTCISTGHTPSTFRMEVEDFAERMRALSKALRYDLAHNYPKDPAVAQRALEYVERVDLAAAQASGLMKGMIMGRTTARQFAEFQLGRGPATMGMVRGLLLQEGWTWPNATVDAQQALDELVRDGRAELIPPRAEPAAGDPSPTKIYRLTATTPKRNTSTTTGTTPANSSGNQPQKDA